MAQAWYPAGSRPRVLINWQSFLDQGIDQAWQWPLVDAVINAYTRWMTVAGVDLRFRFYGFTGQVTSQPGELTISMDRRFGGGGDRLASTFGSYNALHVIVHRRAGDDVTLWPFVPFNASPGEIDLQGVLTHELGHCHGLDHSASSAETMFPSYVYHSSRYGPFPGDVSAVKAIYPGFNGNRLRQLRSDDGAGSWATVPNVLTNLASNDARTTTTPGALTTGAGGAAGHLVGWTIPNQIPSWLRGDGTAFLTGEWTYFGGERSVHGPAYASDGSGRMLWAWVDADTAGTIRIVASTDFGRTWFWVGTPAGARTAGVPALCWTSVNGQPTWICVWANFDRGDHAQTGLVFASTSTDGGWSWRAPQAVHPAYRALSGVCAAADAANTIVVGLSFAPRGATAGMNTIRTLSCRVVNGSLTVLSVDSLAETTRIQPALAFDPSHGRFVLASREQNYLTTLATLWKGPAPTDGWQGRVFLGDRASNTAPALAASPGGPIRLWYGAEN